MRLRVVLLIWLSLDGVLAAPRGHSQTHLMPLHEKGNASVDTLISLIKNRSTLNDLMTKPSNHQETWQRVGKLIQALDNLNFTDGIINLLQWPTISDKVDTAAKQLTQSQGNDFTNLSMKLVSKLDLERKSQKLGETDLISLPFLFPFGVPSLGSSFFPAGSFFPNSVLNCQPCSSDALPNGLILDSPCTSGNPCSLSCPSGYTRNPSVSVYCQCQAATLTSSFAPTSFTEAICIPSVSKCSLPEVLPQPYRFLTGAEYCHPGGILNSGQSCSVACPAGSISENATISGSIFEFKCNENGIMTSPNFTCVVEDQTDTCAKQKPECSAQFQECLNLARYGNNGNSSVLPLCPCVNQFEKCVGETNSCLEDLKNTTFSSYSIANAACSDACRIPFEQIHSFCTLASNPFCIREIPSFSCCQAVSQLKNQCTLFESAAALLWIQPNYQNAECKYAMPNISSFHAEKCVAEAGLETKRNSTEAPTEANDLKVTQDTSASHGVDIIETRTNATIVEETAENSAVKGNNITVITPTPKPTTSQTDSKSSLNSDSFTDSSSGFNTESLNSLGTGSNSSNSDSFGDIFSSNGSDSSSESASPGAVLAVLVLAGVMVYYFKDNIPFSITAEENGAPKSEDCSCSQKVKALQDYFTLKNPEEEQKLRLLTETCFHAIEEGWLGVLLEDTFKNCLPQK